MPTHIPKKLLNFKLPNLNDYAKRSLLVQRLSAKFCPSVFLMSLIKALLLGKTSLTDIARSLSESLPGMSKQSLWERFSPKSTEFLAMVLHDLVKQRLDPIRESLLAVETIKRIIVEDSSHISMGKRNAKNFKSYGNNLGETAGLKVNLAYDLLSGGCTSHTLESAKTPDNKIGQFSLDSLLKGDLLLRDMGYFVIKIFRNLEERGIHWLSRLPASCVATNLEGESLEKILKKTKKNTLEMSIKIGVEDQHTCRLVAVRVDKQIAEERTRKRRLKARKNKRQVSSQGLVYDNWYLIITSLSAEEATPDQLFTLYSSRWAVELQFRGLKHSFQMKISLERETSKHIQEALIYASMIAHQITLKLWNGYYRIAEKSGKVLSLEQLISTVASCFLTMRTISDLVNFDPDLRHITYDKRNKGSARINQSFKPLT